MRTEPNNRRPLKPDGNRHLRLLVEKLENRRLLAGVNVSVTLDPMSSDWTGQSNQGVAGRIVYIDLDHDRQPSANEPVAITNELGRAFFEGLAAGDYSVGLLTDNLTQRQVSPAAIQVASIQDVPVTSQWIIGESKTSLWGLSSDGILTRIQSAGNSGGANSILEIGGLPTGVVQKSPTEAWISYRNGSLAGVAIFNSATRQVTNHYVSTIATLSKLATDGKAVYGVLGSPEGNSVAKLRPASNAMNVEPIFSGNFEFVEVMGDKFVTAKSSASSTEIQLRDSIGKILASRTVSGSASELKVDTVASSIAVVTSSGVVVLKAAGKSLSQTAIIAEATGPIEFGSGRLIAADRNDLGSVTIWSMGNWLPISRFDVGAEQIQDLAYSPDSLQLFALAGKHLTTLNTAVAVEAIVSLRDLEVASVDFAIQPLKQADPPRVPASVTVSTQENQTKQLDLRRQIADSGGQVLWYSVLTGPQHGQVQLDVNGQMIYSPARDYFGPDSVIVRVYDGKSSADVQIHWDVVELNKPPTAILVNASTVSESMPAGSVIGTVSVVDPNLKDTYRITTLDYRFSVINGQLILNEPLDYEAGSTISLELSATDSVGQFTISSRTNINIANVIEAPKGIALSELSVAENVSNVTVGKLLVISPDAEGVYQITLDDPRFKVQGDDLVLVSPLNFEQAASVNLTFTVIDKANPGKQATSKIKLDVKDQDDPPTRIVLNTLQVEEKTAGAAVGQISVADEDGDVYQFYVSDSRFQVVDGILRLAEDVTLDRTSEPRIPLTITALASRGARLVANFPLNVVRPRSPWQNPNNRNDVNGDGRVTPRDALTIIDYLNNNPPGSIPPPPSSGGEGGGIGFLDVNGDGRITPRDALMIINELNSRRDNARAGGEGSSDPFNTADDQPSTNFQFWTSDDDIRRKNNSRIDAELERILDQIASDFERS